ncbi:sensor histidine kinase [Bythopirellula goksoeyrii]|nr:ATP-binding protein [Bythopirellula goksoeyrii]
MRWQPWLVTASLTLSLAALGWWQHHEYLQESKLIRETLRRESHAVMNALVGGFQAHRRRGNYFADQIAGLLQGIVRSDDILAIGVATEEGQLCLSAGKTKLLSTVSLTDAGDYWDAAGFRLVERFELPPPHEQARGGRGGGRGPPADAFGPEEFESPLSADGNFTAVLILDRSQVDARCRDAAWLRGSVAAASGLLLLGLSLAWWKTVQMAGRARLLEIESRHLRDLSQAAAGLAHETRNPLGLIRGWAQRLAQSGGQSSQQQDQVEAIVEECDRVTARINQFLAFARPTEPKLVRVYVKELIDELAILLEPDLSEKKLTLDCQSLELINPICADREMLRQALFNLVQNAIHASPVQETIEIRMRIRQNGKCRIEVVNRGSAIPDKVVKSLFTPYFTTRSDGTGLGLAIVQHIASMHGWEASYSPRSSGGSIFWLDGIHG